MLTSYIIIMIKSIILKDVKNEWSIMWSNNFLECNILNKLEELYDNTVIYQKKKLY